MKQLFAALFLLLALGGCARDHLTVMTFNVRYPAPSDGANVWEKRRDLFVRTVRRARPDVMGTQELYQLQGDYVVAKLPGYTWFGRDRRGGHADEHMGIFYRRDRLTLVRSGDFWLSDTPEVPGSISWGHPFPRMVNWARFRTRSGREFTFLDTHLPYRDEDEAVRAKGAALIASRLEGIAGDGPVVLAGDFNTGPESKAHAILSRMLTDAWESGASRVGPAATFHDFTGRPDRRIDWILARGFVVDRVRTDVSGEGSRYPSDHFPVVAKLRFR